MTSITVEATKPLGVKPRDAERSKNFFALGLICWMYTRPTDPLVDWIKKRFANRPEVFEANVAAFRAGYNFGETAELFDHAFEVKPAPLAPGEYRQITGNVALSYGLVAAAQAAKLPLFYASYPITPASDILHELSKLKNFGVKTLQAEDEISAAGIAIGAAFAGNLAITGTSGPGVDLKSEALGLAVSLELPMIIVDVQRGGPSTGLPTKTEQADLHARDVRAPRRGADADRRGQLAERLLRTPRSRRPASRSSTARPVMLLTDGYLANGAEPWVLPDVDALPDISVPFATEPNHGDEFWPYLRDPETLARPWAIPGTPGLMHRVGGIEKEDGTGNISYDPDNHDKMTRLRAAKIAGIANDIPLVDLDDPDGADFLLLSWGGTWGATTEATRRIRARGQEDRPRASAPPEPVPARPRRRAAPLPEGARAGAEPRSAVEAGAGRVPGRRAELHRGCRRARSTSPSSRTRSWR